MRNRQTPRLSKWTVEGAVKKERSEYSATGFTLAADSMWLYYAERTFCEQRWHRGLFRPWWYSIIRDFCCRAFPKIVGRQEKAGGRQTGLYGTKSENVRINWGGKWYGRKKRTLWNPWRTVHPEKPLGMQWQSWRRHMSIIKWPWFSGKNWRSFLNDYAGRRKPSLFCREDDRRIWRG